MDAATKRPTAKRIKLSKGDAGGVSSFREVTRHISEEIQRLLWGRAAARCEFSGCNKPLWKSSVTQEPVNIAQKAHIYAFSTGGSRGNAGIAKEKLNDFDNLILVCHECHRKIDKAKDGGCYTAHLLQAWKASHERRVEIVTGIHPSKKSHIVLYGANVGDHSSPLNFAEAAHALFPLRYPANDHPLLLGTVNSSFTDRNPRFWELEAAHLTTQFRRRVKERIDSGEVNHLSVFAMAPQPLLILLGSLMIDITNAEVFQRHREPQTWDWPDRAARLAFRVEEPSSFEGSPVLVLALSAPVTDERITAVLGPDVAIWRVTVPHPNTDLIKSRKHLSDFRTVIRALLDRIKAHHGQTTPLHIFPVAGISTSVELGRVRMPKAHMPWHLYDQVNARGGFVPALSIPLGA